MLVVNCFSLVWGVACASALEVYPDNRWWFRQDGKAVALFGGGLWTIIPDTTIDIREHNEWYTGWGANANRATLFAFCSSVRDGKGLAPWPRTGPGQANDGLARFDLSQWDERFWRRLREYLSDCQRRGIVVLLQIWDEPFLEHGSERWHFHPFNPGNHINHIEGLPVTEGHEKNFAVGVEDQFYDPDNPDLMRFQDALVARLLDETAGRYDNVIYEIGNEMCMDSRHPHERRWQRHWIDLFRRYQREHNVKLLLSNDTREAMFDDGADGLDVVNHHGFSGLRLPPSDDDDLSAQVHTAVHRHFRQYDRPVINSRPCSDPDRTHYGDVVTEEVGRILFWSYFCSAGHIIGFRTTEQSWKGGLAAERIIQSVQTFAARLSLERLVPRRDLVDNGLCLADPGGEYVVYLPRGGEVMVDLEQANGTLVGSWYNPRTRTDEEPLMLNGGVPRRLTAPSSDDWVLHLRKP